MRLIKAASFGLFLGILLSACSCFGLFLGGTRLKPHYDGIDPKLQKYYQEYVSMAKDYGISFNKTVSMGFTDINRGSTIGLTWYGVGFREIDIDKNYWSQATEITKRMLIYHEMSHAFCNREHDYGSGQKYDDSGSLDGYFKNDLCPLSILYPYSISDECMMAHWSAYIEEMFQRCDPY